MHTSAFRGSAKIRLTLLLSIPSIGQVSYPSALIASMKWAAERAVLLCAQTRMSLQPIGSRGVALLNPRMGNQTLLIQAKAPWV